MKKRLLITGFDPFGGEKISPAWEAVSRLPDEIGAYALTRLQVPTVFGAAGRAVLAKAGALAPDVILCAGQAGGRAKITPELVAINLRHASAPDNAGALPQDTPIVPQGPDAYFSTLPVRDLARAIEAAGIPAAVSYSAGAFVCNDLFYMLLHRYRQTETRVGFIHVPFLPGQAGAGVPSLPLSQITQGLTAAIEALS